MELTADPEVLFLDEPTSGLDSFNAGGRVVMIAAGMFQGKGEQGVNGFK